MLLNLKIISARWARLQVYIIIIVIIYSLEFFTSALADGVSLKFEWQQVS